MISKNEMVFLALNRKNKIVSALEKIYHHEGLKQKRTEILFKSIYDKNPGMQISMGYLMIDICREEGVSPKLIFTLLSFAAAFIIMGYSRKNPNKSVQGKVCDTYWHSRGYFKKEAEFLAMIKKKVIQNFRSYYFWHWNFKGVIQLCNVLGEALSYLEFPRFK